MNTAFLLLAQYDGAALIDDEIVRKDFFGNLSAATFKRRIENGDIPLPVVRLGRSQKSIRHIHLTDLAAYIDAMADRARRENERKA